MTREAILALTGATILKGLFATLRLEVADPAGFLSTPSSGPVLFCFWHNRILGITHAFHRIYPASRHGVTVLTSPSRDGEILARLVGAFGMGSVRGSSSRRGSQALRELMRLVRAGRDIAITPDGPRGPRYTLGPGVVSLAQITGAAVVPLHAHFSRSHSMRTWDGFIIPLPFSKVSITIGDAVRIAPTNDEGSFENARQNLEILLQNGAH
jgi:lysophospholipid acyltransferase (LPLAT)-like uncharacterized protein